MSHYCDLDFCVSSHHNVYVCFRIIGFQKLNRIYHNTPVFINIYLKWAPGILCCPLIFVYAPITLARHFRQIRVHTDDYSLGALEFHSWNPKLYLAVVSISRCNHSQCRRSLSLQHQTCSNHVMVACVTSPSLQTLPAIRAVFDIHQLCWATMGIHSLHFKHFPVKTHQRCQEF